MNAKNTIKRVLIVIIPLALTAIVVFKLKDNKDKTLQSVYQLDKTQPVTVKADTITSRPILEESGLIGTFEPDKETKLSSEVQGKINTIHAELGNQINKGQPVIQLDNALLKLQLQSVEVQIQGLEDDVKRYTILTEADAVQGIQLEKAKLGLKSASIQQATLQEQIQKSTIRAPFSGVLTAKLNEEGGFAAPGMPLVQLTDLSNLRFTINVPESDLMEFQNNDEFPISVDAFPEIKISGKVIMIGSKANMGNSFPVQFRVKNTSDLKIKSGMFGKVNLSNATPQNGITIPFSAVSDNEGVTQVFLIRNGKASLQEVSVGRKLGNQALITKGLKDGDILITNGFINLYEGANVNIQN